MQLCWIIYCSLNVLHVSSDIIAHHQEHLNCIYSFWFYSRVSDDSSRLVCVYFVVTRTGLLTFICIRATLSYDVAHRAVRSWRQNSFGCFLRWPWNTLRNRMCGVACCRKEWGGSEIMIINGYYRVERVSDINDPVLSSLKMEGILFLLLLVSFRIWMGVNLDLIVPKCGGDYTNNMRILLIDYFIIVLIADSCIFIVLSDLI
jgi:hypothetical protein